MSDTRIRQLERRWLESGAAEDRESFVRESLRQRHSAAELASLGAPAGPPGDPRPALAQLERAVDRLATSDARGSGLILLARLQAWIGEPDEARTRTACTRAAAGEHAGLFFVGRTWLNCAEAAEALGMDDGQDLERVRDVLGALGDFDRQDLLSPLARVGRGPGRVSERRLSLLSERLDGVDAPLLVEVLRAMVESCLTAE